MVWYSRFLAGMTFTVLSAVLLALPSAPARAAERALVGVRIFSPVSLILNRFGDPTFITPGTTYATVDFTPGQPHLNVPGDTTAGTSAPAPAPTPDASGATASGDDFAILYPNASRYYYNFPSKGLTYEFIVSSDGRVIGIKAYGYRGDVKTNKGISLGSSYTDVIEKYGYPEKTTSDVAGSTPGDPPGPDSQLTCSATMSSFESRATSSPSSA